MITLYETIYRSIYIWPFQATRIDDKFAYYKGLETGNECARPLKNQNSSLWPTEVEAKACIIKEHREWVETLRRELAHTEGRLADLEAGKYQQLKEPAK